MNQTPGRRVLVLLVDDCGDQRDLYEALLASEFDVVAASRGQEALALAAMQRPDVVLLDIEMPEMNGFETCRRLKDDPATRAIPVIMLTGRDYVPDDARVVGAVTVLQKPCPVRQLVEAIGAAAIGTAATER